MSSMHFLQKACGQVFSTTDLSWSREQLHIIFRLYSSISIFITAIYDFYSISLNLAPSLFN